MNIHALICDDEVSFSKELEAWLYDFHFSHCDGSIQIQRQNKPEYLSDQDLSLADIVFLDIDMSPISGIAIARQIRKLHSTAIIIFITNYIEYSLEGYEVNAFRYVLKNDWKQKLPKYYLDAVAVLSKKEQCLQFKWGNESQQVKVCDIFYLESRKRVICLHFNQSEPTQYFYSSMQEMENRLCPLDFLRVHKSFLVNMEHIKNLCYNGITLEDGTDLPISQKNYSTIRATYLNWKLRQ